MDTAEAYVDVSAWLSKKKGKLRSSDLRSVPIFTELTFQSRVKSDPNNFKKSAKKKQKNIDLRKNKERKYARETDLRKQ